MWYGVRGSTPPSNIASSNPLILVDPKNIEGTVSILQSNPKGVCNKCTAGLLEGGTGKSGIKYPNVIFEISSEAVDGVIPNGLTNFKVINGKIID